MRERKHLGRLRVGPVDENKWRIRITEGETSKLVYIQLAMRVVAYNAIDYGHYAQVFNGVA